MRSKNGIGNDYLMMVDDDVRGWCSRGWVGHFRKENCVWQALCE